MGMIFGFRLSVTPVVLIFFGGTFVCYGQMEKSTDQEVKIFKTESETFFVCKIFSRLFLRLFATKYFQDRLQYHQKRGKS